MAERGSRLVPDGLVHSVLCGCSRLVRYGPVCGTKLSQPARVMHHLQQERYQCAICLAKSASIVVATYDLQMNLGAEKIFSI